MKPKFILARLFKDNMIFPQKKTIKIFGTCKKGAELKLEFLGKELVIKARSTEFLFELPSQPLQSKSFSFSLSCKKQKVTIYNCQIGQVYLLTGGGNVKLPLDETFNKNSYADDLDVRFFNLDDEDDESWKVYAKSDLNKQGALGYLFASYLYENSKIPVGVVSFSDADATIFSWMSESDINLNKEIKRIVESYNKNKEENPLKPSVLYNNYINKIKPFSFSGVVYYAGENDYPFYNVYESALKQMIKCYRLEFKQHQLPFIVVQIAGYEYPEADDLAVSTVRIAQSKLTNDTSNIYTASAVDLGEERNIVPQNKVVLATRIMNVALDKILKKGKNSLSPTYYSYQKLPDGYMIHTNNNFLNLLSRSKQNLGFSYSEDGVEFKEMRNIEIRGNQILMRGLKDVKVIRYGYLKFPFCDIYTTNELPLLPFEIKIN